MTRIEQQPCDAVLEAVLTDLSQCVVPVRSDIAKAHAAALSRLSTPGTWWTATERVAIAAESRAAVDCAFCKERKEALSPYAIQGTHDTDPRFQGVLPEPIIDLVHMAITDVTRITKAAIDRLEADGLSDAHYVEALGVAVTMRSIDQVCRGLGIPLHDLPEPVESREPSRALPSPLVEGEAFVRLLARQKPTPPDEDLWTEEQAPLIANVIRALSVVPEAVRDVYRMNAAHYVDIGGMGNMAGGRDLSRPQIELLAARVSALNDCFY